MAAKNRFKQATPTINFDDPTVLTAVPSAVVEEKTVHDTKKEHEAKIDDAKKVELEPAVSESPEIKEYKTVEEKMTVNAVEEQPEIKIPTVKKNEKENILAGVIEQKPAGKTYALYLDTDVVTALDKLAKQNKVSRSKALNSLLRSILIK